MVDGSAPEVVEGDAHGHFATDWDIDIKGSGCSPRSTSKRRRRTSSASPSSLRSSSAPAACRPPLAYEAIQAEPSIAAVLPCNVVVRSVDEHTTIEAFDPDAMMGLADNEALHTVAAHAEQRGLMAANARGPSLARVSMVRETVGSKATGP